MQSRSLLVTSLVVSLLLGVLVVSQPVDAHPYHLQLANEVIGGDDEVKGDRWRAQSFVPESEFFVSRIAVYEIWSPSTRPSTTLV